MSVAAVVLAAGRSTRMGAPNKLLADLAGRPVLGRTLEAVLAVTDAPPLVVLGHDADAVAACLRGLPVEIARNPDAAAGQQGSVALGLRRAPAAELTLVVPGDMPFLTGPALAGLIAAAREGGAGRVTVPMRGQERGNPVVVPAAARAEILARGHRLGCGGFTRRHPERVHRLATGEAAFFADIDTPDDLRRARVALTAGAAG